VPHAAFTQARTGALINLARETGYLIQLTQALKTPAFLPVADDLEAMSTQTIQGIKLVLTGLVHVERGHCYS
jgi:hypothetical protein